MNTDNPEKTDVAERGLIKHKNQENHESRADNGDFWNHESDESNESLLKSTAQSNMEEINNLQRDMSRSSSDSEKESTEVTGEGLIIHKNPENHENRAEDGDFWNHESDESNEAERGGTISWLERRMHVGLE